MQKLKSKIMAIMIALILTISMTSIMLQHTVSAHTPPWTISTDAYVSTVPSNIGLGQYVFIVMWSYMKMPDSAINNDIRMQGYMLNITLPDGNVTTLGPFIPDSTETTYTQYTPTELGTYSLVFWYPTTVYYWNDTTYALGGGPGGSTDESHGMAMYLPAPPLQYNTLL